MYFAKWSFKDTDIYQGGKAPDSPSRRPQRSGGRMPLTGAVGTADWGWKAGLLESELIFYIHGSVYKK